LSRICRLVRHLPGACLAPARRMPDPSSLTQLLWLFILSGVVACVAWTVTHEKIFEEPREWCAQQSEKQQTPWWRRKWFYLFTCEYCFSHYVSAAVVAATGFHLLLPGWRGFGIAWISCVWIANIYMSLFGRLRLDIKRERVEIGAVESTAPSRKRAS
jgi:hypothetical protein